VTPLNGYKAILFDLDGVILDSMGHHADLWEEVLAEEGLRVSRDFILEHEGALGAEVLVKFMREAGLGQAEPADMGRRMSAMLNRQARRYILERAAMVRPFPDALRMISALAASGTPSALVTSSRREVVAGCLPDELGCHFTAMVTADDVPRHKPYPDPYLSGAAALGLEAGECLVVENAPAGIAAARAAGAACFAVTTTLPAERLSQADQVFPSLADIARHLGLGLP